MSGSSLPHIPILRWGQPYLSADVTELHDAFGGGPLARISQANVGLIRKDLLRAREARAALCERTTAELIAICARAADIFMEARLPLGEAEQSPADYVAQLSATSGLPHSLVRANMGKLHTALTGMGGIVRGLTRGLPSEVIDAGIGEHNGVAVSFSPTTDVLATVLPSNSPGVNSIWLPALALRTPVLIKPGREEPWTPYRLIQALIAAGCPREAFGFVPTSHEGADVMLRRAGRGIIFGDDRTTQRYAANPGIERHGTGRSKVVIGDDVVDEWPELIDLLATSVANNGGRSCVNASCIVVSRHGDAIAEALAAKLASIRPRPRSDPQAELSAFANPRFAEVIDSIVEAGLAEGGCEDITARLREGPRRVELEGASYLCPTLLRCDIDHSLGNTELLFPFASVVELPQDEMLARIGPSLVVSLITRDEALIAEAVRHPGIDRLNVGALPTTRVEWDQPHEGNLFELLYRRRAIQRSA